ncbi:MULTISPECIES: hypothetical protein [Mesorhizobium]|uniref:Cell envelope integrity protein TolA n=1 Tax=Mesorhizobium denitrificans TaxID=2294114 RepID=A0A371XJW8_9HYPH|nr:MULTISPECIES: hypothetical protein [Mesorhizobium]RFC69537.1 hypothetical protein DY251_02085 [Mesorhizobium denitrificans]
MTNLPILLLPAIAALTPISAYAAKLPDAVQMQLVMMLQAEIAPCWTMPPIDGKAPAPVTIQVLLKKDGSLARKPSAIALPQDKTAKALATSAIRAVERCAPFDSVAQHPKAYDNWRELHINFAPLGN